MTITLKALYDTIQRFDERRLFETDTMYIPIKAKEILNFYPHHKFLHYKYISYNTSSTHILFLGQNVHYSEEILTNEEYIVKGIIK